MKHVGEDHPLYPEWKETVEAGDTLLGLKEWLEHRAEEEGFADDELVLQTLPLKEALWWFIENISEDSPKRNDFFFLLRERVRDEA